MLPLSDAQKELLLAELGGLRKFCFSLTGSAADADDLLQITVERLLQKGMPGDAHVAKWAFRVCKNAWIDEVRSRGVRQKHLEGAGVEGLHEPSAEQAAGGERQVEAVFAELARLPEEQRLALTLVAVEGKTYSEAADILDVPIGTIMSRIARARKQLVKFYESPGTGSRDMNTELTEQDLELLSAFLDKELGANETRAVRMRLLAEPSLRAAYDQLKNADSRFRETLDVPGANTVPSPVRLMVEGADTRHEADSRRAVWGFGLAASLLVAAGVVFNAGPQSGSDTQFAAEDALVSPVLERSLSAGEGWEMLADGARLRPLLSFPSVDGNWCREYLLAHDEREWRGVACRSSGQGDNEPSWEIAILAQEEHVGAVNAYRPAGAVSADQVVSFIDKRSADIPLSREQEAELIARGWK